MITPPRDRRERWRRAQRKLTRSEQKLDTELATRRRVPQSPDNTGANWIAVAAILSNVLLWVVNAWRRLEDKLLEARLEVLETALESKLDHAAVVAIAREFTRDLKADSDKKHDANIDRLKETNDRTKRIED